MGSEADGERFRVFGEERAKRIFVLLPVMGELPISSGRKASGNPVACAKTRS